MTEKIKSFFKNRAIQAALIGAAAVVAGYIWFSHPTYSASSSGNCNAAAAGPGSQATANCQTIATTTPAFSPQTSLSPEGFTFLRTETARIDKIYWYLPGNHSDVIFDENNPKTLDFPKLLWNIGRTVSSHQGLLAVMSRASAQHSKTDLQGIIACHLGYLAFIMGYYPPNAIPLGVEIYYSNGSSQEKMRYIAQIHNFTGNNLSIQTQISIINPAPTESEWDNFLNNNEWADAVAAHAIKLFGIPNTQWQEDIATGHCTSYPALMGHS
ncbi:MAG: hypothetical protein JWO43_192 [Candidatus Adlerbacteria bacterium]|nr:hypothetical protein [Candidatus Adlerbacteria bacterium]